MRASGMQRPVLKHSTAGSWLWLCSSGTQNQPAKHGILPADRAERELCQKFTGTRTHPDNVCRALLLPQWGRCWVCSVCGQILGKTYCVPQTRALRSRNAKFCNSRCSQYHAKGIGTSPVQAQAWGGGGRVAQHCPLGCGRTAVMGWHVPPIPAGSPGWLVAGIQGEKALSEVYQAFTLLLFQTLNNKYFQKSNGSSSPSLASEAELSLVLFSMVGELGRCTWQVVTSHLGQVAHFHSTPFSPFFFYLWWHVPWLKATWEALVTNLN